MTRFIDFQFQTGSLCFTSTGNFPPKGITTVRFGKLVSYSHILYEITKALHSGCKTIVDFKLLKLHKYIIFTQSILI